MASHSAVSIRILDVNDNPPELATPYEASICEDAKVGQVCLWLLFFCSESQNKVKAFFFPLTNYFFAIEQIQHYNLINMSIHSRITADGDRIHCNKAPLDYIIIVRTNATKNHFTCR